MTLIDFTLSNTRRFYSSAGNPLADCEGLSKWCKNTCVIQIKTRKTTTSKVSVLFSHLVVEESTKNDSCV